MSLGVRLNQIALEAQKNKQVTDEAEKRKKEAAAKQKDLEEADRLIAKLPHKLEAAAGWGEYSCLVMELKEGLHYEKNSVALTVSMLSGGAQKVAKWLIDQGISAGVVKIPHEDPSQSRAWDTFELRAFW